MGSSFAAANEIDGAGLKQVRGPTETFSGSYLQHTHSVNTEGTANSQAQYTDVDSQSPVDQKAIKRILRSEGFYLNAEIEGVNILFTIDTGATRTVISDRVYNSIPEVRRPELKKCTVLTDVSGQPLSQQGSAFFTIELASGVRLNSEIMVADIEDDGLFGHDLLSKGGAEILYSEGAIRFMGTSIPCKQINRDNLIRKVRAASDFTIPGHSEMIVDAFLDRSEDDDLQQCDIILEPCSEFQERYGLLMAYSLSDLDSKVTHKVRMLNPFPHAISVNQDATLGTAEVVVQAVTLVTPNDRRATSSDMPTACEQKFSSAENPGNCTLRRMKDQAAEVPDHLQQLLSSSCANRSDMERSRITDCLVEFQDTFSKHEFDLGLTSLIEHEIDVGNSKPIKQPPRRVPVAFATEEENVIKQLEQQGVIRKSSSPWASPICLVRKRSGKIRPCVDYRRLNAVTIKDAFPLPRINDCLDAVAGAELFSSLDLTSSFHQVPMKKEDIPKTAFCTKYGLYEYLTMPMGLSNSPAVLQRLMQIILGQLQWHSCLIYLDDVLIFGSSFEEHMQRLEEVLSRIRDAGLKPKPEKCQLLQSSVNFLGHTISAAGVLPNPENLAKVKQWPTPTTPMQVRQILGLGSYYRRFLKGYSDLVRPLTLLTHKDVPFVFSDECKRSFETLKTRLIGAEIMAYPRDQGLFVLDTDASDTQISGVLSQVQEGQERVISYGSRTLNKAERNYCITDKELLAVRHFTEYYRQYLLGRHFLIRSDHQALTFLFKMKEPKHRIARWIEILSAFDFSIEFRKGSGHGNADALSRCPDPWNCECSDIDNLEILKCGPCAKCKKRFDEMRGPEPSDQTEIKTESIRAITTRSQSKQDPECRPTLPSENLWSSEEDKIRIRAHQENDSDLTVIIRAVETGQKPCHNEIVTLSPAARYYWSTWDSLVMHEGCLYWQFYRRDGTGSHLQFLVPKSLKDDILYQVRNTIVSGHLGRKKTLEKLLQRFFWYGVRDDVYTWILRCDICAANKRPQRTPRAPLGKMQVGAPFDRLSTDYLGPLPLTPRGNHYILVATCAFTKWVEVIPVPDLSAKTCANRLLNEVISRFGSPLTLHSDLGRNYESSIMSELCKLLEIKKTRTSVRNPRCNGQVERFNRSILRMIKSYLCGEQESWDLNLGCLAAAYRACPNETTRLSPNLLMLGRELRIPSELLYGGQCNNYTQQIQSYGDYVAHLKERLQHAHEVARKNLSVGARRQSETYDSKLAVYKYKIGDIVWAEKTSVRPGLSPKLQSLYQGPCLIVDKYNDLVYRVQLSKWGICQVLHHNKLKPYEGTNTPRWLRKAKTALTERHADSAS
ncbi:MAG: reverse transcriptase domain-containing protein [Candidatus Thiodiazotropha endolucinida]